MQITLDRALSTPLSEQLSTALAGRIHRGALAPGARLPTIRALASELDLAPNTVAKAYSSLEAAGLIEGRGRHGTFVARRLPARMPDRERQLAEAALGFVARGAQLGFRSEDIRRAVSRALRGHRANRARAAPP